MATLEQVYEVIREDARWDHLRHPGIVLVPGRGNAVNPIAMIVGEAPGATENLKRRPFCGPSGRVLMQLMELAGLDADSLEANAFITNVLKYRPPGNRTPDAREIHFGQEGLRQEWIAIGKPRLIVAVGAPARAALTPAELRLKPGQWAELPDGKTSVYVQYHPQWGIRQGTRGRDTMERQWEEMGEWMRQNGML